jgi:hypothetical protein
LRKLPPRKAAPTEFGSDGSVRGGAGRKEGSFVGATAMEDAAKAVLAGDHGNVGFNVTLAQGTSWEGVATTHNMPARYKGNVYHKTNAMVAEIVKACNFDKANVNRDEVARLTKANAGAIPSVQTA